MARASVAEQTGSTGELEAVAKFTRINWGFAEIAKHDNGIDVFLLARDDRRFDLGLTLGAQIKSGPSYFTRPKHGNQSGELEGWWFNDSDGEHLADMVAHGLPQLLVLYNLDRQIAYWVHVNAEAVMSTGKGAKILVPITQTVDEAHRQALLSIASVTRPQPAWEGSAWAGAPTLAGRDVLRHALMAPRLVAPHPNIGPTTPISPGQAVAMLVQARLLDLHEYARRHPSVPTLDDARGSSDWAWRFFGALGHRVTTGEVDHLPALIDQAPSEADRTAAAVVSVAGLIEEERPDEAIQLLSLALGDDQAAPIDHAWLLVQRARAHAEIGGIDQARADAARIQGLQRRHPNDVTAAAIEGIAAQLLFRLSDFGDGDLARAVRGADTAVAWWRQQIRGRGLSDVLDRTFTGWARDTTKTWITDEANNQLVAASLTASFAGDQSDWRYITSLLGRDALVRLDRHDDPSKAEVGLTRIRRSGDTDAMKTATERLVNDGPALAVRAAAAEVSLNASTATTIGTDLDLLGHAGPVLDNDTANRAVTWILGSLSDPSAFTRRTNPRFDITWRLLKTLAPVLSSSSEAVHEEVITHFVSQPPIHDQLAARGWRKVINQLDPSAWTGDTIARASSRAHSDHPDQEELRYALLEVTNNHDPAVRAKLLAEIKGGSLKALAAIGDVRTLDPETVQAAVVRANAALRQIVDEAHQQRYAGRVPDPCRAATVLCLWHPDQANWGPILDLLTDPMVDDDAKYIPVQHLGNLAHRIPDMLHERLGQIARELITHRPAEYGRDIRGPATLLQAALSARPDDYAEQLYTLVRGGKQQRIWAARLARHHVSAESAGLVAGLGQDHEPEVRAASAAALTTVVATTDNPTLLVRAALRGALDDPGFLVPVTIAATLADLPHNTETSALASRLAEHPLAPVRRRINAVLAAAAAARERGMGER
jgi:Domain of unknown function (DUF4365)